MITKQDLQIAIAECQGVRSPTANTAIKLAAYYIILDHMDNKPETQELYKPYESYSYSTEPVVAYSSDTEFGKAITGIPVNKMCEIVDELMTALAVVNPKLYDKAMLKFSD